MKALVSILILLFMTASSGSAQSGRNKQPPPSPSPAAQPPPPASSASPSPKPALAEASPTPDVARSKFHPSAFIIPGRTIIEGGKSFWRSDDVKSVADEIKFMWDLERMPAKITKGGKLTRTQAVSDIQLITIWNYTAARGTWPEC